MSAGRRNRPQLSLSLFPFLAVLICTMGVLIVLLVIVVKHADSQAEKIKQADLETANELAEKLQIASEVTEARTTLLADLRKEVTDDLQQKQQFRSNIQLQINQLRDQAEALKARYERMQSLAADKKETDRQQQSQELKKLQDELAAAKSELDQSLTESKDIQTSYAIVPYHGNGGTKQRPIFVECTADAVILQPYGIELTPDDFAQPLMAGNPLDAALLTIRDYLHDNGEPAKDEQAYPLLVVRPDGAASYGIVRRAMKSWVDQFGYELIPNDLELSFPEENASLRGEIEKSLVAARIRTTAIRRAASRPEVGLAQIASNQFGSASTDANSNGTGLATAPTGEEPSSTGARMSNISYRKPDSATASTSQNIPTPADPQSQPLANGGAKQANQANPAIGGSFSPGLALNANRDGEEPQSNQSWNYAKLQNAYRDGSYQSQSGTTEQQSNAQSTQDWNSQSRGRFLRSTAPNPIDQTAAGSSSADGTSFGSTSNSQASANSRATANSSFGGSSGNQSLQTADQQKQTSSAQLNQQAKQQKQSEKSLASVRGKDWALPNHTDNATLYRRQIFLDCSAGQLRFRKSVDGQSVGETINFNSKTVRQIDEMIDLVWKRVESWGMAGVQSYWQPQLMIRVGPDGEQRATELRDLLDDSGLDVILISK